MSSLLFRTHRTSLTDDELILLDVLFKWRICFAALRREDFAVGFNCDSHNLDDVQLVETLARFCEEGFLRRKPSFDRRVKKYGGWFEMTARGGELWESERTPVWERFVRGHHHEPVPGNVMVSFCGPSAPICEDFLRTYWGEMVRGSRLRRVRLFKITNHELIPWKSFPTLHAAVGVSGEALPFENYLLRDRSLYESRRSAWSTVQELQKFVGSGRGV
jgi:hypothetical protein